jgi:hypothetical protein
MESFYKVIISGDRNWTGPELEYKIECLLLQMPRNTLIIHGDCKGVDKTADKVARRLGFPISSKPADWERYGRGAGSPAGPIRNTEMLNMGVDVVYAFHQNYEKSKGTKDMVNQAKDRGVPAYLIT